MDATRLAQILSEEFERDHWGTIDPYLFKTVGQDRCEEDEDAPPLRQVMERVAQRINQEQE